MSVPSAKLTGTSLDPRMERERTRVTPGTRLTASSIGRVTAKTCCRAESDVPSATTVIRWKFSSGYTADGSTNADQMPPALSSATAR